MKKTLPLLIKNVLLPLLFTLPGILSNREANDLQITSHQTPGTLYTTSTLDTDSRWNPAPKSSQQQRWNLDSSRINHSSDDSASAIQSGEEDVEEVRVNTQQEDSTQRNQLKINAQQEDSTRKNQMKINAQQEDPTQRNQLKFNTQQEDQTQRNQLKINTQQEDSTQKNQMLEGNNGGKEEEAEQSSQTTTVHMPTYFSYGTTRRANYRDRVNSNRNFNGRINQEAENGTSFVNGRRNNVERNSTSFVNDKKSKNLEDQEYGRISSRVVGRSNNDEDHVEDSTSVVNSRSNNNYDVEDSRRSTSRTNNQKGNGNTVTVPPTSNQPTMTYSSDFFKLTSPKLSTFGKRVNITDVNYFTNTQLPSTTDRLPESQTSIKYTTNAGRGGRILTGRRKVNESATTQGDSDRYLERIHQQIQASTFSPFSTTSYHDANKNLEYKKKPIKKETEGDMVLASGGGKGGEKLHVAKTETQKTTEIWDKIHKDLVKNKENVMNMTQKPIEVLDERYSTIIDTLSKGSGNVPQSIISQKNVTINNEPGTNLLENENAGSKENNEKRETKEKDVDETKSRGDVIPVIIKNSVVGEGVSDLLNKTVNFRYPDDVKPNNESFFSSGTNGGEFSLSKTDEKSGDKNLETNERIIPQVDQVLSGREAEAEKDEQEIKKKIYNLKKPLLPTSGGKLEDGFEVMLKNGSSSDSIKDDVTYFSSSVPSLELNETATHEGNRSKLVEQDETKTEEENGTKMNELRETRIISSTSRITSSFSSNKLGPTIQQQYTTFASNNLENNIITTSSPLVYGGFTSTTPRVNHYFSMRTSTTVQSQPATSAGENLIKQISSFNPRKRPAVTYYQTPAPQLSTKKSPEMFGVEESSIETEGASSFTPGHHSSSTSMRTDTVRKIVPWSTRLQKTTLLPESTTMDYSDETTSTTFSYKASSVASPDWSLASSEVSAGLPTEKTFSTTFSLPTATFVTSETPWTPLSRTTSRSVDETSSVTDSSGQAFPASKVAPGRSTKPAVDASVYPGSRATVTYLDDTTIVPTSSSQSFSITTAESPTSSVVNILENTTTDAFPSVNSSIRWGTASSGVDSAKKNTTSASEPSVNSSSSWGTTSSGLDLSDSAKEHTTSTLEPSVNPSFRWGTTTETVNSSNDPEEPMLTTSKYPHPESTSTWETGNTATDLQINNKTTVEPSSSPSYDLETNKSDDMVDSTTWSSYGDGNSTEDLQFGDVGGDSGRWKSTTTSEETTVSAAGESGENESITPVITSRIPDNLTSTSGMPPLSRPVVTSTMHENLTSTSVIPPITRQNFMPNSISKQISTSGPNSTLNTNITSTTKTPETAEDSFETDEEEIQTTTSVSTEGGEYEQEDDDKTTTNPDKDNRIVPKGNGEGITTQRNNFIMKISTTESPLPTHLWTTDSEAETTTVGEVSSKLNESSSTTTPSTVSVESVKTTPMQRPIKPVTIEPDPPTTNPQYIMGLSLLIKGSTLQEICDSQSSLKKAIVLLFRNTTGRILYEDQIVFPNLTPEECKGAKAFKNGYHNIDMMLFDENGNFDDELNSEFRKLWENNGLRTNIAIHDVYLILRPQEDVQTSGMTIAVIVIACIGLTCLLLFFILMMILRKRQKKFNYGQRCTPVSLDDYSLDNISVYNSIRRKNARRASKRSYGNPAFDDPSAPSNQMNFAALSHFCSNRAAMDDEFDEIPKFSAKMDELPPGAETRNRYANVIPLPETRVQLAVREGDDPVTGYINANYVKGPKGAAKFYIACQAPMQSTVNDFWRMIWEQQSKLILMLTDLHENGVEKCFDYLPPSEVLDCHRLFGDYQVTLKKREVREKYVISHLQLKEKCFDYLPPSEVLDCHRLFGDYQVTLKKREVREKYVISHLQLKNLDSNLWREVTHLWYSSWPHQGTPSEGASMIAYLIEARAFMRNSNGPHIVHCSPGVGRTGTVLAIDLCIREFETCRMVDVPKTVSSLRRDRAGCVQTKDQYAFIYMVLNVYGTKLTGGALDSI